nr:putative ribonuclease H-like domain-containing protein [Tanacetum cinerariifolium]
MDLEFAQNKVVTKLPLLKQVPRITTNPDGTSTLTISGLVIVEEKAQKTNDDVKTFFEAKQARFGGNDATKKTQKTLLKQLYENFNAPSTESLDFIFNRLQKIVSQLAILDENISQEDLNMKFLRNLPAKWNTHVVVWKNKPDLETMSFDDLYNNFKIVKQEVKRTVVSSSSSGSPNMAFLSSPSSKNEVDTASIQVSDANTPVSIVSSPNNNANLNDETVYAFLANQPNGSQLVHEDLEQIHEDDLEEMDLKWQLALLSMRARRECRSQRSQESWPRNQDSSIKTMIVEDTSSKAMVAIDEAAFNWSYMGDDEVPANMALMAFSDSDMIQIRVLKTVKKGSGQREVRLVWNHAMRVNHQNFSNSRRNFTPTAVLTKSGIVPISTSRQSSSRVAALVSTVRPINTAAPKSIVKFVNTVNTAKGKSKTSVVGKQGSNVVKSLAYWVWRPKTKGDPQAALRDTRIFNSGCSRRMTRNKSFLSEYQEYDGGFVAFVGSSKGGKITVLLKVPKKNNMYSFDLKNVVPSKGLTCLFAKAINDESNLWHGRLGHINFKTINKLMKKNLVRGLPSKIFENDHTCVACQKGKQHKDSCKSKLVNSVSQPLHILYMDLFGPTFIKSIMGKMYCLVVTDDYSRFSWVFFLAKKDETYRILKDFITRIENQLNHKVKIIRCDNGTEFKNYEMNQFCGIKGIKREFSNARTPQQNKAEAPYELLIGRAPIISFMRPFGCPVTILNTLDHLEKFDGKADEGFLVSYSINSKAFRVYNSRTKKNYQPVSAGNRTNGIAGSKIHSDVGQEGKEKVSDQEYILLPVLNTSLYVPSSNEEVESSPKDDAGKKSIVEPTCVKGGKIDDLGYLDQQMKSTDDSENTNSTNSFNTASLTINTASDKDETFQRTYGEWNFSTPITVNVVGSSFSHPAALDDFSRMPNLKDTGIFDDAHDDRDEGTEADYNNLEIVISTNHMEKEPLELNGSTESREIREGLSIEEIRIFLAYASFMDFTVYQMDVKSVFLYGTIEEEVYVSQPPGFVDP